MRSLKRKHYFKRKNNRMLLIFIFLFFNLISIIFISSNNINLKNNHEDLGNPIEDITSNFQISSSNPPNSHYFEYYKPITINHEMVSGSGSHINFPVLISILDEDLHNQVNQSNGNDIAFANDNDWLDHEIEFFNLTYNSTHAKLIVWVRILSLSTSVNTTIYMYYGNSTMDSRQNPTGVWASNYKAIWHLNTTLLDSTSNNNDGTNSVPGPDDVSAFIARGRDYLDVDYSNMGSGSSIDNIFNGGATVSTWIYPEGWGGSDYGRILDKSSATSGTNGWVICLDGYDSVWYNQLLFYRDFSTSRGLWMSGTNTITLNQWQHIVITYDDSSVSNDPKIYINGVDESGKSGWEDDEPVGTATPDASQSAYIGNFMGGGRGFNGVIDEVRIFSGIKSSGWILTEYNNQYSPETFFSLGSEVEIDKIAPTFSNLEESSDPLELGETEVISINVSDPSGIFEVKIEIEGMDYTMTNVSGDIYEYNEWTPGSVGNYTYTIYMYDNMYNWDSTNGTIEVLDRTPPKYSNLIESSDPLELGTTETIQINVTDYSPIDSVWIEIANVNRTMTFEGDNIYEYNVWTPSTIGLKNYRIFANDTSGNWNIITNNITVQDTIKPSAPILTNSPSGNNIVFDWLDGSDPSGISYYILIIDNETDFSLTPGYIYKFNITNTGQASSFYEVTDEFSPGKYYYFLAQVDGVGHQSDYTIGTFTFNLNSNDNNLAIYIIVAVILASVVGSVTVIVTLRKKSQKKMSSPRKKIPIKVVLTHLDKIFVPESTLDKKIGQDILIQKEESQSYNKELLDKQELDNNVDKIKSLGEDLFKEGAYLEAIKQFQFAKEILSNHGRNEDAILFSDLVAGIEGLIEEREKRLEILETEKNDGDSVKIFELYFDIMEISKKLRDLDAVSMFQSELIQYFQMNKFKLRDIEIYKSNLEKEADSLSNNGYYEKAAQIYAKCEEISQLLVKFEKEEELANLEKYINKKNECLDKILNAKFEGKEI